MRVKAIISYKGTAYYGYQVQPKENEISIQGVIQDILSRIFQEEVIIYSSGRTDRGVHALGQVIHFDLPKEIDLGRLKWSINSLLPKDIHFINIEEVSEDFHARYSVISKEYRYIVNIGEHDPLNDDLLYNYNNRPMDINKIKDAMKEFVGEHNFYNFCSNDEGTFDRVIESFTLKEEDNHLIFDIKGNGFRRYMVRMIVGTCLEAGLDKINPEQIRNMLYDLSLPRTRFKAPACGLYLVKVNY